jgi:hypothetical protein
MTIEATDVPEETTATESNTKEADTTEQASTSPAASDAKPGETALQAAVRKMKLKINGRETELSEDAVIAMAQKSFASDEKFKSASEERKRVEKIIAKFKDDPDAAIEAILGKPAEELYKERLAKKLEDMGKDPRDLELEQLRSKLAAQEKKQQEDMSRAQKAKLDQATEYFQKYYDVEIPKAIKAAGLPATEETVGYFAEILSESIDEGIEIPMHAVADLVKERYTGMQRAILGKLNGDDLIAFLGEDKARELASALGRKKPQPRKNEAVRQVDAPEQKKQQKFLTPEDLRKELEQWKNS